MTPQRNRKYLALVRSQPCAVCASRRPSEAAHTGPHGLGQKSSDFSAIPLCRRHHRIGNDSYHALGPRRFADMHGLDIPALVAELNEMGLGGSYSHRFGKMERSPGFTRFHCACSFRTAWYRMEPDARAALHNHIDCALAPVIEMALGVA
jgi:hypothetical protein